MTDQPGTAQPTTSVARVRRWAWIQLATIVIVVVGVVTAASFRLPEIGLITVLRPILLIGFIVALGELLRDRGVREARSLTAVGLLAVAAELSSIAITLWLPIDLALWFAVAARVLVPAWLFATGWVSRRDAALPHPLPRRAMIGAVGQAILAFTFLVGMPAQLLVLLVGLALAIPTLGFFFGLTSLDRPNAAAAPAVADVG